MTTPAGAVNGTPDTFTPTEGDTSNGGAGQPVDSITCDASMSSTYHVHVLLAVYVNGVQYALPSAIGMKNPGTAKNGFINLADCFYWIHTHDSTGLVHIEDPSSNGAPLTQSLFTSKQIFDIWGITVNGNQFGPFTGPVRVFTSGQTYRGGTTTVPASDYTYWSGDPNAIPLYSHEVIIVEVGPTYPTSLPNVDFSEEY